MIGFIHFNSPIRDILDIPLRLPHAIAMATKREELEVISAMGAGRLYVHTSFEINEKMTASAATYNSTN